MGHNRGVARIVGSPRFILISLFLFAGCVQGEAINKTEATASQTHVVEIRKFRFQPHTLEVRSGDTIRWVNKDIVPHRIAHKTRRQWESLDLKRGDSFRQRILVSTGYVCALHPTMRGNIIVKDE